MLSNSKPHFSSSNFMVSIPGLLKIAAVLLFLISSIVFLSTPVCSGTPLWFSKLYPISAAVSGILIALLYAIFSIGIVKRGYRTWMLTDLIFDMLDFTAMLVVSIVTITQCSNISSSLQMLPGPMGIIGAIFLVISSVVGLLQSRSSNDLLFKQEPTPQGPHLYRKSVMV